MKRSRCGGIRVEAGRESLISSTGASLLMQTAQVSGLVAGLSRQLRPWRAPRSIHDPGKTVLDLAIAIALGGDCLADAALVRAQPELFGAVASDPTISRLIDAVGQRPWRGDRRDPAGTGCRPGAGVATALARSLTLGRWSSIWMPP